MSKKESNLKTSVKSQAKSLKALKLELKDMQRFHGTLPTGSIVKEGKERFDYEWKLGSRCRQLLSEREAYRQLHVAYCLLGGRKLSEIERSYCVERFPTREAYRSFLFDGLKSILGVAAHAYKEELMKAEDPKLVDNQSESYVAPWSAAFDAVSEEGTRNV